MIFLLICNPPMILTNPDIMLYCKQYLDNTDQLSVSRTCKNYYNSITKYIFTINNLSDLRTTIRNNNIFDMNYSNIPKLKLKECLEYAIEFNIPTVYLKILLHSVDLRYNYAMAYACKYDNHHIVCYMMEHQYRYHTHNTLESLAKFGSISMCNVILHNTSYNNSLSPIYISQACTESNYKVALEIYKHCIDRELYIRNTYLSGIFRNGNMEYMIQATPYIADMSVYIGSSIAGGHIEALKYVLRISNIRLNSYNVIWGLACACRNKHYDMIEYVLKQVFLSRNDIRSILKYIDGKIDYRINELIMKYQ